MTTGKLIHVHSAGDGPEFDGRPIGAMRRVELRMLCAKLGIPVDPDATAEDMRDDIADHVRREERERAKRGEDGNDE